MDLDQLLKSDPAILKNAGGKLIRTSDEPEEATSSQRHYLLGLARDYLPHGHSRFLSESDVQAELMDCWYDYGQFGVRKGLTQFHQLTKREAGLVIEWLLVELGRERKISTPAETKPLPVPETEGECFSSDESLEW